MSGIGIDKDFSIIYSVGIWGLMAIVTVLVIVVAKFCWIQRVEKKLESKAENRRKHSAVMAAGAEEEGLIGRNGNGDISEEQLQREEREKRRKEAANRAAEIQRRTVQKEFDFSRSSLERYLNRPLKDGIGVGVSSSSTPSHHHHSGIESEAIAMKRRAAATVPKGNNPALLRSQHAKYATHSSILCHPRSYSSKQHEASSGFIATEPFPSANKILQQQQLSVPTAGGGDISTQLAVAASVASGSEHALKNTRGDDASHNLHIGAGGMTVADVIVASSRDHQSSSLQRLRPGSTLKLLTDANNSENRWSAAAAAALHQQQDQQRRLGGTVQNSDLQAPLVSSSNPLRNIPNTVGGIRRDLGTHPDEQLVQGASMRELAGNLQRMEEMKRVSGMVRPPQQQPASPQFSDQKFPPNHKGTPDLSSVDKTPNALSPKSSTSSLKRVQFEGGGTPGSTTPLTPMGTTLHLTTPVAGGPPSSGVGALQVPSSQAQRNLVGRPLEPQLPSALGSILAPLTASLREPRRGPPHSEEDRHKGGGAQQGLSLLQSAGHQHKAQEGRGGPLELSVLRSPSFVSSSRREDITINDAGFSSPVGDPNRGLRRSAAVPIPGEASTLAPYQPTLVHPQSHRVGSSNSTAMLPDIKSENTSGSSTPDLSSPPTQELQQHSASGTPPFVSSTRTTDSPAAENVAPPPAASPAPPAPRKMKKKAITPSGASGAPSPAAKKTGGLEAPPSSAASAPASSPGGKKTKSSPSPPSGSGGGKKMKTKAASPQSATSPPSGKSATAPPPPPKKGVAKKMAPSPGSPPSSGKKRVGAPPPKTSGAPPAPPKRSKAPPSAAAAADSFAGADLSDLVL